MNFLKHTRAHAHAHAKSTKKQVAKFVNASTDREIVFTRNASEAINLVAYTWGRDNLKPGDEVVVSVLEHHSNLVPWQIVCQQTGATLRHVGLAKDGSGRAPRVYSRAYSCSYSHDHYSSLDRTCRHTGKLELARRRSPLLCYHFSEAQPSDPPWLERSEK